MSVLPSSEWVIRRYRESDRAAVYEICVKTGDSGDDVTGLFSTDNLFPDIWAGPYLHLEPDLTYILESEGRAVGYVLGTAGTSLFVERYRKEWLPLVADNYREPAPEDVTAEAVLTRILLAPEVMCVPEIERYPAHLHIDILAEYRHVGAGGRLIGTLMDAVRQKGAIGAHVGVTAKNTSARAFYRKVGFEEARATGSGQGVLMVMSL